jgi:hypothetical protein
MNTIFNGQRLSSGWPNSEPITASTPLPTAIPPLCRRRRPVRLRYPIDRNAAVAPECGLDGSSQTDAPRPIFASVSKTVVVVAPKYRYWSNHREMPSPCDSSICRRRPPCENRCPILLIGACARTASAQPSPEDVLLTRAHKKMTAGIVLLCAGAATLPITASTSTLSASSRV